MDDVKKGTQVIQECSQVLLRMIDDILELSRVASGRVSLHSSVRFNHSAFRRPY